MENWVPAAENSFLTSFVREIGGETFYSAFAVRTHGHRAGSIPACVPLSGSLAGWMSDLLSKLGFHCFQKKKSAVAYESLP